MYISTEETDEHSIRVGNEEFLVSLLEKFDKRDAEQEALHQELMSSISGMTAGLSVDPEELQAAFLEHTPNPFKQSPSYTTERRGTQSSAEKLTSERRAIDTVNCSPASEYSMGGTTKQETKTKGMHIYIYILIPPWW